MDKFYCSYLNENIEDGMCYDLQMIGDGYIKEAALPEINIDREELNEHCSKCKYCLDK